MSTVDSVTPFARSFIIYFNQLSCQSLFKKFIGWGKKAVGFFRIFLSICGFLCVDKPNLCFNECSLPLRLEKMLFKQSQHDQKPNCNTNPASKSRVQGHQKPSWRQKYVNSISELSTFQQKNIPTAAAEWDRDECCAAQCSRPLAT